MTDALATGYRLIDTAAAYLNEEAVQKAIRASGIPPGGVVHHHQTVDPEAPGATTPRRLRSRSH